MAIEKKEVQSYCSYMNVQNVKIYYEKYDHPNPKATFLFIHGFMSSTFSFRNIIPYITSNASAVAIDLPGFGKSEKSLTFHYSFENYGRLIIEMIEKLKLQKVVLFGHSMGGQIALYTAKQAPEYIEKLILISSSGYLRKARRLAIYSSYLPYFSWFVKQWYKRKEKNIHINFLDSLYDKSLLNEEIIKGYVKPFYDKHFFDSLVRLLRHREGDLSASDLKQIITPTILIWGKDDNSVPLDIGYRLKEDLPNSRLAIIENVGHLICEEKPELVYREVLAEI